MSTAAAGMFGTVNFVNRTTRIARTRALLVGAAFAFCATLTPAPVVNAHSQGGKEPPAVKAVVDLSEQTARFYGADGTLLRSFEVSTGKRSTPTPTGRFKVWRKSRHTYSIANPEVKMEYMTNFKRGYGFHGIPYTIHNGEKQRLDTPLGERGVSAGCVRMRDRDARWVFLNLRMGATVIVKP